MAKQAKVLRAQNPQSLLLLYIISLSKNKDKTYLHWLWYIQYVSMYMHILYLYYVFQVSTIIPTYMCLLNLCMYTYVVIVCHKYTSTYVDMEYTDRGICVCLVCSKKCLVELCMFASSMYIRTWNYHTYVRTYCRI